MLTLDIQQPFSFARTLEFMTRFPACRDACTFAPSSVTAAVALGGVAYPLTLRETRNQVSVDVPPTASRAVQHQLRARAEHFIGAHDDLAPLYAAAEGDTPFTRLVAELHGLHHVRFLTLAESVVYAILMRIALLSSLQAKDTTNSLGFRCARTPVKAAR